MHWFLTCPVCNPLAKRRRRKRQAMIDEQALCHFMHSLAEERRARDQEIRQQKLRALWLADRR